MRTPLLLGLMLLCILAPAAFGQPSASWVSPSSGSSAFEQPITYTFAFTDPVSAGNILNAQPFISNSSGSPACNFGYYEFPDGSAGMYLVDAWGTLMGPIWPGSGSLDSAACGISPLDFPA